LGLQMPGNVKCAMGRRAKHSGLIISLFKYYQQLHKPWFDSHAHNGFKDQAK
jgi:hypothetical protein